VEVGAGSHGLVGLLEADEGVRSGRAFLSRARMDDNALNLAIGLEEAAELILIIAGREVLHEEVALLLGVLVAVLLLSHMGKAGMLWNSMLHIKLEAIKLLIVKISNCTVSAFWPVKLIILVLVADECKGPFDVVSISLLLKIQALDISVLCEHLAELSLIPRWVEVLHVDIVDDLASFTGVFRRVLDDH